MSKAAFTCIAIGLLFKVSPVSAQIPTISAVVNGADFSSRLSPGVMASVIGTNLGPTPAAPRWQREPSRRPMEIRST
jgi:hypothetical protein